jgi:hypothetical protein
MSQIEIGNVIINSDGRYLTFKDQNKWQFSIDLEASTISDFIEYLRSFNVDDVQRRRAFRVPLTASSGLSVILGYKDKSCSVKPLNISLAGILIEFYDDDVYDMAIDTEVELTLKLGDKTSITPGTIVRRDENQYGIFFPDSVIEDDVQPPLFLQSIVLDLERDWIRKRVKIRNL